MEGFGLGMEWVTIAGSPTESGRGTPWFEPDPRAVFFTENPNYRQIFKMPLYLVLKGSKKSVPKIPPIAYILRFNCIFSPLFIKKCSKLSINGAAGDFFVKCDSKLPHLVHIKASKFRKNWDKF